jgi:hypothetical protein
MEKTKGQDLNRNETRQKRLTIPEIYGQVYHFHSLKHSSMSKSIVFNPSFLGITYNHQDLMFSTFCYCAAMLQPKSSGIEPQLDQK